MPSGIHCLGKIDVIFFQNEIVRTEQGIAHVCGLHKKKPCMEIAGILRAFSIQSKCIMPYYQ